MWRVFYLKEKVFLYKVPVQMNRFFRQILFISFFLQALIPVGFMPSFANDEATFVICSGVTGEPMTLSYDGKHPSEDNEVSAKCPYYNISATVQVKLPTLPLMEISYISTNVDITQDFITQSITTSNLTRGPPHNSLI